MKAWLHLLLFCYLGIHVQAQPVAKGIWDSDMKIDRKAAWIWHNMKENKDVLLARKTFKLDQLPHQALLHLTASSQYQLYVNGQYVARGPARCAPHHQSFDTWEIVSLLEEGNNVLAIRVHHQQNKHSYSHQGRAGLLAQLNLVTPTQTTTMFTDSTWKVSPDLSWDSDAPLISRFQQVVNDRVDMQGYFHGWEQLGFDDQDWAQATPLMRKVGWPGVQKNASPQSLTPPWTSLTPRDIPYLQETLIPINNLIHVDQLAPTTWGPEGLMQPLPLNPDSDFLSSSSFMDKEAPWVISSSSSNETRIWVFDLGEMVNGITQLKIKGPRGTRVDLLYAPFVVDHSFTHKVVDSDFRDQVILSGKKDMWEATYFKPTRYLALVIPAVEEEVQIDVLAIRKLSYPFEIKGRLQSNDAPWVESYTQATINTLLACTTDAYTDNYRERRQYAQTNYYAALGNYWVMGDLHLQRRYLLQVAQEQQANGIMPAYAPLAADDFMIILDSNCLWLRGLRNYFLYSGDTTTVLQLLPAAYKLLGLLHGYTHELGFIYDPPYAYWLDHARNDRRGANFTLNGHYLGALEDMAEVLGWLGEPQSKIYQQRADLLRNSLQTYFWDSSQGLFVDAWIAGERSPQLSEHANAMALAMNIATPAQAASVAQKLLEKDPLNYIRRASGMTMVTPAMSYFLHKGLCEYGYLDESFELFRRRFDKMLAPNTNHTLWEEWWLDGTGRSGVLQKKSRSDAQTESAFPTALFAEYLVGITPMEPGLSQVHLAKTSTQLKHIAAQIPSPWGILSISWDLNNASNRELQLDIPKGMELTLDVQSLDLKDGDEFHMNGQVISFHSQKRPLHTFTGGKYTISF